MPITAAASDATTVAMRYASLLLGDRPHRTDKVATFIASRRLPGQDWLTWDLIAHELITATGMPVNREAMRRWAIRLGIPTGTAAHDGEELTAQYRRALAAQGITL